MSKTRKRMLLSSLVMLIVAAMALASVTYAWFTTSKTATVTNIQFTAKAAEGIQLSANGSNGWKGTLTSADIAGATDQGNFFNANGVLVPVSTVGAVAGGQMAIFKGIIDENNQLDSIDVSTDAPTGTEMKFYKFNIYIKNVGAEAVTVKLASTGNSVTGGDAANGIAASGIENAARVAFIDQKSASANNGTASVIWEPNTGHTNETAQNRDTSYTTQGLNAAGQDLTTANKAANANAPDYFVATA
ncbi:MAG: hypothetical protein IJM71_00935, partial [Clostridia bacterium]|nr:hypothetical protein [Clostridia bacterium]